MYFQVIMGTAIAKGLVGSFISAYGSMKTDSTSCIVFMISDICPE